MTGNGSGALGDVLGLMLTQTLTMPLDCKHAVLAVFLATMIGVASMNADGTHNTITTQIQQTKPDKCSNYLAKDPNTSSKMTSLGKEVVVQ